MKSSSKDQRPKIPLEDQFEDIIGKAQRGLGFSDEDMTKSVAIPLAMWRQFKNGAVPEKPLITRIAQHLNLSPSKLLKSAHQSWYPDAPLIDGIFQSNTAYKDMWVNSYLVWDPDTMEGAIFDTGSSVDAVVYKANKSGLTMKSIFITHTHTDHILALDSLREQYPDAPVYTSSREPLDGAELIEPGTTLSIGQLTVENRLTWGHSQGALTYVIRGLSKDVAIVGDAIFAGSMGGGMISYKDALRTNREEILSLPDDTILCPGHGPHTTVGLEKANNPFF